MHMRTPPHKQVGISAHRSLPCIKSKSLQQNSLVLDKLHSTWRAEGCTGQQQPTCVYAESCIRELLNRYDNE